VTFLSLPKVLSLCSAAAPSPLLQYSCSPIVYRSKFFFLSLPPRHPFPLSSCTPSVYGTPGLIPTDSSNFPILLNKYIKFRFPPLLSCLALLPHPRSPTGPFFPIPPLRDCYVHSLRSACWRGCLWLPIFNYSVSLLVPSHPCWWSSTVDIFLDSAKSHILLPRYYFAFPWSNTHFRTMKSHHPKPYILTVRRYYVSLFSVLGSSHGWKVPFQGVPMTESPFAPLFVSVSVIIHLFTPGSSGEPKILYRQFFRMISLVPRRNFCHFHSRTHIERHSNLCHVC